MKFHAIALPVIAIFGVLIYQALRYGVEPAYILAFLLLAAFVGARIYSRARKRKKRVEQEEQVESYGSLYLLRRQSTREIADKEEGERRVRGRDALTRAIEERLSSGRQTYD